MYKRKNNGENKKKNNRIILMILGCLVFLTLLTLFIIFSIKDKGYEVKFDSDGGTEIATIRTNKDGRLTLPSEKPYKDTYIFNGWYLDNKLIFSGTTITNDAVLKASWMNIYKDYVHVVYSPGNGIDDIDIMIEKNQKAIRPNDPIVNGKKFLGWYLENVEFDFNTELTDNIIVIGKWEDENLKCSNHSDNDECNKIITINAMEEYICEEGWAVLGKNCVKPDLLLSVDAIPVYSCNDDYKLNNDRCEKELTTNPTSNYYCSSGVLDRGGCYTFRDKVMISERHYEPTSLSIPIYFDVIQRCSKLYGRFVVGETNYECIVAEYVKIGTPQIKYSCANGYKLENGICHKLDSRLADIEKYRCDEGYYLLGDKCYEKDNIIDKKEAGINFYCYSGFNLENDKCTTMVSLTTKSKDED